MLAGKKKKKKCNDGPEFLEDKLNPNQKPLPDPKNPDPSITDIIFHRKHSPSTGYQKVRGKRCAPKKWSEKETKLFYKGLEMFGTDFSLIETLFSQRNKKQLLRKFHKEKKRDPSIVQLTLERHGTNIEKKLAHYGLNLATSGDQFIIGEVGKLGQRNSRKVGELGFELSLEEISNSSFDSVDQVFIFLF